MQTPADRTAKRLDKAPTRTTTQAPADRIARRDLHPAPADRTALRR